MPHLSPVQRENALGRLQAGQTRTNLAHVLNVSPSTKSCLRTRFQRTGSSADDPRTGRPHLTTQAQDRFIRLRHLRNRFLPASSTVQIIPGACRISDQIVWNRLRAAGLRAYRPLRGNVLTRRHHQARLQCRHWTMRNHSMETRMVFR
jgi:hypothetical protein